MEIFYVKPSAALVLPGTQAKSYLRALDANYIIKHVFERNILYFVENTNLNQPNEAKKKTLKLLWQTAIINPIWQGLFWTVSHGGRGMRAPPHHNFVVIAPMIMKFGTGIKLDVFYTMVTKKFVTTVTTVT